MKAQLFSVQGKKVKDITLPACFEERVREDIVHKVLEAKKRKQPYAPSASAGKQYSSRGKIRHRRHVWQTHYGRGMSRVPRKVMSRRGTQFNWEAAGIPPVRGGPRAHPPKVLSMIQVKKINKKEFARAFRCALSATASPEWIVKRYATLDSQKLTHAPFVMESPSKQLKAKELLDTIKTILGSLFVLARKQKTQRSGKGKARGRKYKSNQGLLLVIGKGEPIKTKQLDVVEVRALGIEDLAKGGLGRLTLFTQQALKELSERFASQEKKQ